MAAPTPPIKLISATPSPYARKVRIALAEKQIPFELVTEVPWDSTATTPSYNPLGKLPVLLVPNNHPSVGSEAPAASVRSNGRPGDVTAIYESHFILEWLEAKFGAPRHFALLDPLFTPDERLKARQVEVVADGMCDACVLRFFEVQREEPKRSPEWIERQMKKLQGGMRYLDQTLAGKDYMVGRKGQESGVFGLADVAAGSVLGYLDVRFREYDWRTQFPRLNDYMDHLMDKQSFKDTVPYPQTIKDKIV